MPETVPKASPRQLWQFAIGIARDGDNYLPRAFCKNALGWSVPPGAITVEELRSAILSAYAVVGP